MRGHGPRRSPSPPKPVLGRSEGNFIDCRETEMQMQGPVKIVHVPVESAEQLNSPAGERHAITSRDSRVP